MFFADNVQIIMFRYLLEEDIKQHDGRVVKALDLSSNGRMSAWVRSPLLVNVVLSNIHTEENG